MLLKGQFFCGISVFLLWVLAATSCLAGGGPENAFLLVNSTSQDSMTVANHYIELRKIPPGNVFYIDYRKSKSYTTGQVFREEILLPALVEIKRRGLSSQIDYLVYSCDFPWRISFTKDFPEVKFPPQVRPTASLTGATYLAEFVVQKRKELVGPNANFYCADSDSGVTTSRGFRSQYKWTQEGKRTVSNGLGYCLSAILGVTDGRGNSVDEIVRYLTRSVAADATNPKGTIYYLKHGGPRSTPRHRGFEKAIREIRLAGVRAELIPKKVLTGKTNIMGLTCGAGIFGVRNSGCKFLPGAFCDNFTSYGGIFVEPNRQLKQTCVSEFLREGAAGANGTVIEPYGIAQKFPSAGLHVHYVHGCSLAEAFYQSVKGPYQQLLVGDPLCQPWAKSPQVSVSGIREGDRIRGVVEIVPSVSTQTSSGIKSFNLYVDGTRTQRIKPGSKFVLDTKLLADGLHEIRIVAVDSSPIESQGRWIGTVIVKNGFHAIQLSVNEDQLQKELKYLQVRVVSTDSEPVVIFNNGRELGRVAQGSETMQIDLAKLGSGPVALYGQSQGDIPVRSNALKVVLP